MPTKYDPRRKRDSVTPLTTEDLTALTPEQDFSPVASAKRELVKSLEYDDTRKFLNQQYTKVSQRPDAPATRGPSPKNLALAALTQQINEVRDTEAARQSGYDVAKFSSVQEILRIAEDQGAHMTVDDVKNLVDFSVVNDAADTIIAGMDPNVGDPNVAINVATTLADTNPVAASMLMDVVQQKLADAATDPTLITQVADKIAGAIGWLSTPFVAAWDWSAQGVAAGNYAAANSGRDEFVWPNQIAGYFNPSDRAAVERGKLNQEYLQQLAEQTNPDGSPLYTPLQMEIVTEIVRRQAMGDPQPMALWQEKYNGNLQAAQIFGDLAYNRSTGNTQELYRQVRSASLSDLGASMLGSARDSAYDPFRGTDLRSNIADVTGFITGFAADPTNLAFGAGRAVQAARWSLTRLAPGAGEADKVLRSMRLGGKTVGFEFNPAYRFFDNFTSDLNKYDDLLGRASDAASAGRSKESARLRANAADLRGKMARQYDEMPEQLIDDFYKNMPRNADGRFDVKSAAAWIDETNNALDVVAGKVMPAMRQIGADAEAKRLALLQILHKSLDAGERAKAQKALDALPDETAAALKPLETELADTVDRTFYAQVGRTTQTGVPLIPRMSAAARARKDAVNSIKVTQASPSVVDRLIAKHLPDVTNADTFADDLARNAEALGFDVRSYRMGGKGNVITAPVDALGRMASSLPDVGRLALHDASSTKAFYRLARAFLPKRIARLMADEWRAATPGARRKMLNGMVRSGAAVRGIRMTDDQLAAFMSGIPTVDNLATGTRLGERYAVTLTDGVLPTERAAAAAMPALPLADEAAGAVKAAGRDLATIAEHDLAGVLYDSRAARLKAAHPELGDKIRQTPSGRWFVDFEDAAVTSAYNAMFYPNISDDTLVTLYRGMREGETPGQATPGSPNGSRLQEGYGAWWTTNRAVADHFARRSGTVAEIDVRVGDLPSLTTNGRMPIWGPTSDQYGMSGEVVLDYTKLTPAYRDSIRVTEARPAPSAWEQILASAGPDTNAGPVVADAAPMSLSADANGIQHALHMEDTADYVRIPSLRDFEDLRSERSLAMQGYYYTGRYAGEKITNGMSFLTLYGLRFSLRNAIEEDGLFLFMGGGVDSLAKGRQMDQAVRRATPRFVIKNIKGQPTVVMKSSLGMVANKAEGFSRWLESKGSPQWLNELVYSSIDRKTAEAALIAKKAGDPDAYANLVIQAEFARRIGRKGFSMLSDEDRKILKYFAESSHGQALYDEVAGGAAYLQNAAMPNFVMDADMLSGAVPGIGMGKLKTPSKMKIEGYGNVPPVQVDAVSGNRVLGVTAWWEQLRKTLQTDGPIGEVAVRLLRDPQKAKAEIARIIREDTEFGYKERLSRITDDIAVDEFANSYFENVFQHFTKSDGTLNVELQGRFLDYNQDLGRMEATWWRTLEDGDGQVARVGMAALDDIPVADRPEYVFGPKWSEELNIPIPESEAAFFTPTRGYNWMARQNTRISRGPVFMANMVNSWQQTMPVRQALAGAIARGAGRTAPNADDIVMAERLTAKQSMDQAYNLTLSYVDNPANRSNLAWKARNVSRYYRATEDFWRRMKRVAKNKPETFWRIALTYQLATDTAFVYQDDQGTAYIGYPGNEQLNQVIARGFSLFGGVTQQYADMNPFFVGAKLAGATPSTDLNQQLPTAFGSTAVALTTMYSAFPALYKLKGLQALTLGQYAQVTGNPLADFVSAMAPPLVDRVQQMTDPEQFDASTGQAGFDTLAIMYAEGLLDTVTVGGKQIPLSDQVTPDQFRQSEEYIAAQKIAIANVITRSWFQFSGAAAPQQYANNVSKIGRDLGLVGLKPEFYMLLDANADAPDPWAAAQSQFLGQQVRKIKDNGDVSIASLLPFTLSTHKSPTDTPEAALAALSDMRVGTQEWLDWWESDNTRELVREGFRYAAYFLAPRHGEFGWISWQVAKNDLGLKVKKSEDEMIQDLLSLNGSYTESQIRGSYRELIALEDPTTEQGKANIKALEEQQSLDIESNKILNPSWDLVSGQRNAEFTDANYRAALGNMRDMLNYMRDRDGGLTGSAEQIDNAINIYLYYQQQIYGLQGSSSQRSLAKKQKQAEMDAELAVIAAADENAAVFIGNVIDNLSYKPQFSAFGDQ